MKVSTKLYGAVGTLALTGLLAGGAGILYSRLMGEELREATEKTAVKLDLVNAARARVWEMVASLRGMYVAGNAKNGALMEENAARWEAAYKRTGAQIDEMRPLLSSPEAAAALDRFQSAIQDFSRLAAEYQRLCRDGRLQEVPPLGPRVNAFTSAAANDLDFIKNRNRQYLKDSQARAESLAAQSLGWCLVAAFVLLIAALAAVALVRTINATLVTTVAELHGSAGQVAAAANQVSASSQSLAEGSSSQAASLQETSSSSEQINAMAHRNGENARAAVSVVTSSQRHFEQAETALAATVEAVEEINAQSDRISRIIRTIDEIAFQTNILALNAAVEAARAGEAGMGFAVVAEEVRNLAQRSAQAAQDTAALIEGSIVKSKLGKARVDEVEVVIRAITMEAVEVKTLVDAVNRAGDEEGKGFEQINKALEQMGQLTQKTAADAEETAAAAEQLNALSESLKAIAGRLNVMIGGADARVAR